MSFLRRRGECVVRACAKLEKTMKNVKALSLAVAIAVLVTSCTFPAKTVQVPTAPPKPTGTMVIPSPVTTRAKATSIRISPFTPSPFPSSTNTSTPASAPSATSTRTPTPVPPTVTPSSTPVPPTPTKAPAGNPNIPFGNVMTSPDYGIQAFLWWRPGVADRDLGLIKEAGFRWVKQWFAWKDIEIAPGKYDWSHADRIVKQVHDEFRLKLLARTDRAPSWAGEPPEDAKAYADFLHAMALRYKGRIQAYQIWNEPNLAREWGGKRPDPAGYARMLKLAYQAIKSADPDAIVISAGMSPTGTNDQTAMPDDLYIEELYKAMGNNSDGYFDMLGVHAAGYKAPPELDPAEAKANKPLYGGERFFCFRHVEDIRKIMVAHGDAGKRVAILEFGWTSDKVHPSYSWHAVSEKQKADYIVRAFKWAKEHWTPWIAVMTLIYMPDSDWTEKDEQYWWSITRPMKINEWKPLPAYIEVCEYLNSLKGQKCPKAPKN